MSTVGPKPPPSVEGRTPFTDITGLPRSVGGQGLPPRGDVVGESQASGPADVISLCEYIGTTTHTDPTAGFPSHSILGGHDRLERLRQHCEEAAIRLDPSVIADPEGRRLVGEWLEAFRGLDLEDQERIGEILKRLGFFR